MRYKIWEKDDFFLVGGERTDMDPSVVELPDETILEYGFNYNTKPLGRVSDIRLEDGEITGEVEFWEPTLSDETFAKLDCRLAGYYNNVYQKNGNVTGCSLRSVSMIPWTSSPGYPKPVKPDGDDPRAGHEIKPLM